MRNMKRKYSSNVHFTNRLNEFTNNCLDFRIGKCFYTGTDIGER